jgi:hypothetical protein
MPTLSLSDLPPITQVFVLTIAALTTWLGLLRYNDFSISYGPTILTMVGIFGCFLGIALGLMHFNPAQVEESMPALVDGIKTSFWASVAGVGGALLIKFRLMFFGPPRSEIDGQIRGATIDDLANLLSRLQQSLAGQDDSTLLSQVKLMRQESHDGMSALKASFDDFLEKAAENNSKALIQALQEVIRDFNAKINEQFGDNFKQLNAAVEKLVVWQDKYRQQLEEMILQQKTSAQNMTEATSRYQQLVSDAKVFTDVSSSLRSMLQALDTQRSQLQGSLEALARLVASAATGLPKIEEKILEMTRQIDVGVRANNEQWAAAIRAVTHSVQTSSAELKQLLAETVKVANQELNTHVKQMSEQTRQQIVALDKALSEELTRSLDSLGRQLTALSQRFVEDYMPLTDRLRQLVQMSRAV